MKGVRDFLSPTTKDRAGNKCPVPFARNSPFGCFAQKVPDTYFPLIAKRNESKAEETDL